MYYLFQNQACREFTSMCQLIAVYNKINATEDGFEIIDISLDEQEREWKRYFTLIPWISLPYDNCRPRKQVCTTLEILCKATKYCNFMSFPNCKDS